MKNNLFLTIILMLVFTTGGFFSGMKYQQSKQPSRADLRNIGQRMGGAQHPEGSQAIRGEIIEQGDDSITIKLPDESSKIILLSENTEINKAAEATKSALTAGEQVMIFGKTNPDGSVTAVNIQIGDRPQFRKPERE